MEMKKYYELLAPEENDEILIVGHNALPLALYLAGKARLNNKKIKCKAILLENEEIKSEMEEIETAKKRYPEHLAIVSEGIPFVSFERNNILGFITSKKYTKCIVKQDDISRDEFIKLGKICSGKLIMMLSVYYFRKFKLLSGFFLFNFTKNVSFKKILESAGLKILNYEIETSHIVNEEKQRLMIMCDIKKFNPRKISRGFETVSFNDFATEAMNEIHNYSRFVADESRFAVKSKDEDYIYIINVSNSSNTPYTYNFIFLDGKTSVIKNPKDFKKYSKKFNIIVVPNVSRFVKELEQKEILLIGKDKVLKLFIDRESRS